MIKQEEAKQQWKEAIKILCINCCKEAGVCIHCDKRAKNKGTCDKCKRKFNYN